MLSFVWLLSGSMCWYDGLDWVGCESLRVGLGKAIVIGVRLWAIQQLATR